VPLILLGDFAAIRPSNDRNWVPEQRILPSVTFGVDSVTGDSVIRVRNVRNYNWTAADSVPHPGYEDRTYPLSHVASVSYIVTPFSTDWRGPAHTFVSFGFDDSTYVGVSVEARKEVGESYTIAKGLAQRFELMYVIGDEHDLIPLRASKWGDEIEVYPVRATRAQARAMFVGMMKRAHKLETEPEFYGSIRNNCTTNILDQVNEIATKKIKYSRKILLPGYSDELAMELGLLDTDLSLEDARKHFRVNEQSAKHLNDVHYSTLIRQTPPFR
jgi:hypothetical protein